MASKYTCVVDLLGQILAEGLRVLVDTRQDVFTRCLMVSNSDRMVYCDIHLLLMYVHLGFHVLLSGLDTVLVDIHPEDMSTSKDLKLVFIGLYLSFHHSWLFAISNSISSWFVCLLLTGLCQGFQQ
jgi:hypothetical protein